MSVNPGLYEDVEIYDILHAPGTAGEVQGLRRTARRFVGRAAAGAGATWLEPACGTGRYLVAAARRGIRAIGFDLSPAMVEYASKRLREQAVRRGVPRGSAFCANMTHFVDHLGSTRADFAFNPINTIRHLDNDIEMLAHLAEVAGSLKRRGVYALGMSICAYGLETPTEDVWEGSRRGTHVKQVVQYVPPEGRGRFEKVYSHLVITTRAGEEHRDSSYRLRCYSLAQWMKLIDSSAMELIAVVDDQGNDMDPPEPGYAVWILRPRPAGVIR